MNKVNQIMPGVYQITPGSYTEEEKAFKEQLFINFLKRLNDSYEKQYGCEAPSFAQYKRENGNREHREALLTT